MRAYVLIQIEPGYELEIIQGRAMSAGLSSLKGVVHADMVYGEYDLVVVLDGDSQTINNAIHKIRKISHIKRTESLITYAIKGR